VPFLSCNVRHPQSFPSSTTVGLSSFDTHHWGTSCKWGAVPVPPAVAGSSCSSPLLPIDML